MIAIDSIISNFELPSTGDKNFSLEKNLGKNIVIYFYPKDDTPGCTTEGQDFRDHWNDFIERNCVIVGISRDSIKSHEHFKEKMQFPFDLLSDVDEVICQQFGVMKLKNMYGKQVYSIERSTFVIDVKGKLRKEWRGVKVPGHVEEVLSFVTAL